MTTKETASQTDQTVRHRVPLSRDRIVQTALHVMDAEGLEAVTMRRIGGSSASRRCRSTTTSNNVMRLFAEERGPVRSIDSMRPMEYALRLFREAGLCDRDTAQAFHAFGGYIQGFVIMELGSIAGGTTQSHLERHMEITAELPEEFEALRAVDPYFAECDSDEQFEFGLDLLIRGVLQRVVGYDLVGSLGCLDGSVPSPQAKRSDRMP